MLGRTQRQARTRAPRYARRERVEALRAPVAGGWQQLAEAEAGRLDAHVGSCRRERLRELVVVPRRVRGGIREHDLHRLTVERHARTQLEPLPRQHLAAWAQGLPA